MKFKNCDIIYKSEIKKEWNICLVCISPNRAHIQTAMGQFRTSVIICWHWLYCVFQQNKYRSLILHTSYSWKYALFIADCCCNSFFSSLFSSSCFVWLLLSVVWCGVVILFLQYIYCQFITVPWVQSTEVQIKIARTAAAAAWWPKTVGANIIEKNIYMHFNIQPFLSS